MYQSFSKYKKIRESFDFNKKIIFLYENIAASEMSVDEWWEKHGLPIVLENAYSNEEELLMELMGGVGNFLGNAAGQITQGAQNLGRGLAAGWQQGRQSVPVWQPNDIMSRMTQQPEQPDYAQSTSQNPYPQRSPADVNQILSIHQQLIQKLKDLQAAYAQNKDQQSYGAVQNLMQQMNALPNLIRNLNSPQPQMSPGQQNKQKVQNIDPAKRQAFANRNRV